MATSRIVIVLGSCLTLSACGDDSPQVTPDLTLPTCTDLIKNGDETDADCGGSCPGKCADWKGCVRGEDCASGYCNAGKQCAAATCGDAVKNGKEADVDCGSDCPTKCGDGKSCSIAGDCASGLCAGGKCASPSCDDKTKNGMETDVDCGGGCPTKCGDFKACSSPSDCASAVCNPGKQCSAPSCSDLVKNGKETDVDCGADCPTKCKDQQACVLAADCMSGLCAALKCSTPTCTDGAKNGMETDVDCGGACASCAEGKGCAAKGDCSSMVCSGGKCAAPTCTDGVKNGMETDVDCGGTCTDRCCSGSKQSCKTACGTGEETCVGNKWDATTCTAPKPQKELCDGQDNDCNGQVDETCACRVGASKPCYGGAAGTENVGICKGGTSICILDGAVAKDGPCVGEVKPAAAEDCGNGLDDDCNGKVNDGCVCTAGQTQPCGLDVGVCKKGTQTCQTVGGKLDWGACTGSTDPVAEKTLGCDGKDNDCNGTVDDNLNADGNEPNNACVNVHAPAIVTNEDNGAVKLDKYNLYPTGDVDIIQITAQEKASTLCVWPLTYDQCHMLKLKFTNPAVSGVDLQYTIQTGKCGGTVIDTRSAGSAGPYAWAGFTGVNEDKDFWVKVEPKLSSNPSFTCMPYTIEAQMVTECGHCCTFVACKDNAACTKAGCGSCDTTKGVCKK